MQEQCFSVPTTSEHKSTSKVMRVHEQVLVGMSRNEQDYLASPPPVSAKSLCLPDTRKYGKRFSWTIIKLNQFFF